MKNFDLESMVKSLRVPERGEDYWESFPQQVLMAARHVPAEQPERQAWMPRFALSFGLALLCLFAGFGVGQTRMPQAVSYALLNGHELRRNVAQFEARVGRLMQDEHGLHRLVEDQP